MTEPQHEGVTAAGVAWTIPGTRGDRWCLDCLARMDREQDAVFDVVPDADGVLHARLKEPR